MEMLCVRVARVTRSGDFLPKNAIKYGYFLANLQKFWAIFRQIAVGHSSAKILILAFFVTFGYFCGDNLVALCVP